MSGNKIECRKYDKFEFKCGDVIMRTDNDYSDKCEMRANGEQAIINFVDYYYNIHITYLDDKKEVKIDKNTLYDEFVLAYALTVHKSQGSQAKRVILFEERFKAMDDEQWRRWLYTGVTRAQEELYVIG